MVDKAEIRLVGNHCRHQIFRHVCSQRHRLWIDDRSETIECKIQLEIRGYGMRSAKGNAVCLPH